VWELLGPIRDIEAIAIRHSIRDLSRLRKKYGSGRWRKLKGWAHVRLRDGTIAKVELHWYEAHGVGKREMKIARFLD
jgi:hypothetical protein